jgi:glutamate dehydrogenase
MAMRRHPKLDRKIAEAKAALDDRDAIDPAILFSRVSLDDLGAYSAAMLARVAIHAHEQVRAFTGSQALITITRADDLGPEGQPVSIVSITDRNQPFLYDSTVGEVTATFRTLFFAMHPILVVRKGAPVQLFGPQVECLPEERISHIQFHLPALSNAQADSLEARLRLVIDQVHAAVGDWRPMLQKLEEAMAALDRAPLPTASRQAERREALAFLSWLRDNNFTFLGMREYVYSARHGEPKVERARDAGIGILADPEIRVLRLGKDHVTTTPEIIEFLEGPDSLIVTKANMRSLVHRRAYMDYVGVKLFDETGALTGELRIVGLFTSTAYTRSVTDIPLLRRKVETVVERLGFDPESHSGKMLFNTLESYPRDDLFQIDTDTLVAFCAQINELADRPRVRALARIDRFDRFVSIIVFVPRDQYDSDVRQKIGAALAECFDGHVSAYYPSFPEGNLARVHFIVGRSGGKTPRVTQERLEAIIHEIATRWEDRFALLSPVEAPALTVSEAYRERFSPSDAIADLKKIEQARTPGDICIELASKPGSDGSMLLKIFHGAVPVALSRRVPLLENLGFDVISERTFEIGVAPQSEDPFQVVLHEMEVRPTVEFEPSPQAIARIEEAFLEVWNGRTDNDAFNRLVIAAGLAVFEAAILRAYGRYMRQLGVAGSQGYIAATLGRYPAIARKLFDYFAARFANDLAADKREAKQAALRKAIEQALSQVANLEEDRILRRFTALIQASLRTNYFQHASTAKDLRKVLAIKLNPRALEFAPAPKPFREIFVYGAEVEGVHLRFGPVARGGLRWSDRPEDYRTEVLGLVKAQQVKNAVIVPVGSKGGFFPKQLPAGGSRDTIFEAGREAYKTFVSTLLSVTDTIEGTAVVHPADTVCHDGDDPYFVVAADKGTATFSDTANAISQAHGFWLDDAFASGGSAGYDHKKMGITARGAWEAVKRHFREMDVDIQATPFTVAGVGDMSGDVFGNGMLLSKHIRLVAAFDHRDIFIDPDPDAAVSFSERQRLFDLPRSSWQDYDKARLSKGGMIVSRQEKSVKLTREAAAAIGLDQLTVSPPEIMSAILKAPVDLLWFGGIGTYIRAEDESDAAVGDRANDAIRVTAGEVRAKVIGEGANLGVTQRGRIAYNLKGGRSNSDAIDNSAGVNSSDVEVNIKIALASAMRDNRLTRPARNRLLTSMTEEGSGPRPAQQLSPIPGGLARGAEGRARGRRA